MEVPMSFPSPESLLEEALMVAQSRYDDRELPMDYILGCNVPDATKFWAISMYENSWGIMHGAPHGEWWHKRN